MSLKSEFLQNDLATQTLFVKAKIIGSQTQASIKTFSDGSTLVYNEDDSRTVDAVDSQIGFALTDLDNDAPPAVLGFLVPVGDAEEVIDVAVPLLGIVNVSLTGAMTAGVATLKGSASTGRTATAKNIAFIMSCTSLDIDEDNSAVVNCSFWTRIVYRKTSPGQVA
jgi:hypothetical protein